MIGHALNWIYESLIRSDVPNIIQVASGVAAVYAWRRFMCVQKRCGRFGRHVVPGTTYHTCHKHLTPEIHAALTEQHAIERPVQHAHLQNGGGGSQQ